MDDNRFAKIAKNGKPGHLDGFETGHKLTQKLNIDITGEQAPWIKYRTWSYKKKLSWPIMLSLKIY